MIHRLIFFFFFTNNTLIEEMNRETIRMDYTRASFLLTVEHPLKRGKVCILNLGFEIKYKRMKDVQTITYKASICFESCVSRNHKGQ